MALRVSFVCTGNICRSPAAHAVFAHALAAERARGERWPDEVIVESAGLGGWHVGELPDPRAQAEGARRGFRLDHRARQVAAVDLGGLVIAMDQGHHDALQRRGASRLLLFRSFDPLANGDLDVADPYYGDDPGFAGMFEVIERTTPALLAHVRALIGAP